MIRAQVVVVKNLLPGMDARALQAVSRAVAETMVEVETGAKERAPVDTGNLRASITGQMQGQTAAVVGVGPQAPYGVHVHEGTRRMSARPFLRQAAESARHRWTQRIRDALAGLGR